MAYLLKKQKHVKGPYKMYDTEREPLGLSAVEDGETAAFNPDLGRAVFMAKAMIPGFGGAYIFADNLGKGYEQSDKALDFLSEGCRSHLKRLREYAGNVEKEIGFVPKEAERRMRKAEEMIEGRVDEDIAAEALKEVLWAGEEMALFAARNKIALRGNRPFLFGNCMKGFTENGEVWRERLAGVSNYANVPLVWGALEPSETEKNYKITDEMIAWAQKKGLIIKGHALIWLCNWEKRSWMGSKDFSTVRKLLAERNEMIMSRYKNIFECVELINEPLQNNPFGYSPEELQEIIMDTYRICRLASPKTRLMISFFDEWQYSYDAVKQQGCTVNELIRRCIRQGMDIDVLGIQFHDHAYDLFGTVEMIDLWQKRYGLPIHPTELITFSDVKPARISINGRPGIPDSFYWHEPWSEYIQQEWYEAFLTLFYSMDKIEGCGIWGFSDGPTIWCDSLNGHVNERYKLLWKATEGIIREDKSPKPAYIKIRQLLRNWDIIKQ